MKRILGWFVDDWVPVESYDAYWDITTDFGLIKKECGYQIVYSKYQKRYKLRCWGYRPKSHKLYFYAKFYYQIFLENKVMENTNGGTTLVAQKTRN